jgi:hypothetical protein
VSDQLSLGTRDADEPDGEVLPRGVLTNRWNLLEFLSRRLVTPLGTFPKYYDDLLRLTPGTVPIVRAPLSEELVSACSTPDDPAIFPVFLEVDDAIGEDPPVIEMTHVVRVHFRSQRDLEEHTARAFENVPAGPSLVVTPTLFSGGTTTVADIERGERKRPTEIVERLTRLDKFTGGVCVAAALGDGDAGEASAIARLVDGQRWRDASAPWLQRAAADAHATSMSAPDSLNARLFDALYTRLLAVDTLGDPLRFVRSVDEEMRDDPDRDDLAPALKRVADILDGEADFERFKPKGDAVVKALLMLALRPDPAALSAWTSTENGADPETRLTALFLSGVLSGRRMLSLAFRPEPLDLVLTHLEAERAHKGDVYRCDVSEEGDARVVTCNGDEIARVSVPPAPLAALLSDADLEKPDVAKACAELAARHGWIDIVTTIVEAPTGFTVTSSGHIEIAGLPTIRRRVDRDGLLERVADPATAVGPEADRLRELLAQAPKKRTRKK